ncbi:MAG: DUF58 domain-containing protein [Chloroflexi bacterium]|nr:MAG: DUF58 domain-containing protein [Chloroflexota bacterium]
MAAIAGIAPIVITGPYNRGLWVAFIWLAGVVLAACIDGWFAWPSRKVTWTREHDPKLSLGVWNEVRLTLDNRSQRVLRFRARDAVPRLLIADAPTADASCREGSSWVLRYRVLPLHRGDYTFPSLAVRYLGPLGLVWFQQTVRVVTESKVYPDITAVRTYETLLLRGHLEELGMRRARLRGSGTAFERLREYTPDDEFRCIDWKATARRHKPIAVDYETERSQSVFFALDSGRLMSTRIPLPDQNGGSGAPSETKEILPRRHSPVPALSRLDYSVNAATLLAFVSQSRGDRVGLVAFSDRVLRFVAAAPGRRQFLKLTSSLYDLEPEQSEADYGVGLGYLAARLQRRCLIAVFTDVAGREAGDSLIANVVYLARRHLVLVVTLRDPGVESIARQKPDTSEKVYTRAVGRFLLDNREQTLRHLRARGILTLDVSADEISSSVINRYLEIKARAQL